MLAVPSDTKPIRAGSWGRRQWFHLLACVTGFAMVVWCVMTVTAPLNALEWVGRFGELYSVTGSSGSMSTSAPNPSPSQLIFNTHKRAVVRHPVMGLIEMDEESVPEVRAEALRSGSEPLDIFEVWAEGSVSQQGWWAVTSHDWAITTVVVWKGISEPGRTGVITDDEWMEIRRKYWEAMARIGDSEFSQRASALIASRAWSGTTVHWPGYLINTATLLGLGMWLWFTPILVRDVVRWRRVRRGRCGQCNYDLRGLPEGSAVCPECGTVSVPS